MLQGRGSGLGCCSAHPPVYPGHLNFLSIDSCVTIPPTPASGGVVNGFDGATFYPEYDYASDFFYPGAAIRPWSPVSFSVGQGFDARRSSLDFPEGTFVSSIRSALALPLEGDPIDASVWRGEISKPALAAVIDPEYLPTSTVYEDEIPQGIPQGIYETNRAPTDWDRVYEEYVKLNAPVVLTSEEDMAVDWGQVIGGLAGGIFDPLGLAQPARALFAPQTTVTGVPALGQTTAQRKVTVDLATGRITACRRRRRPRLLTEGDFNDLMRIGTLPNKDTVKIALAKAIGRR